MRRIPEPELMESTEQAHAYSSADFSESNNLFIKNLFSEAIINTQTKILDLGCGDGEIPIKIFKKQACDITAVDGSGAMLNEFRNKLKLNKINEIKIYKGLIDEHLFTQEKFDIVISNSLVHHIRDIRSFWHNLIRLVNFSGLIICMDLKRPTGEDNLQAILKKYGGSNRVLLRDFENSLRASYTVYEIEEQLISIDKISFSIKAVSDRHFFVSIRLKR